MVGTHGVAILLSHQRICLGNQPHRHQLIVTALLKYSCEWRLEYYMHSTNVLQPSLERELHNSCKDAEN